MSQIVPMGAVPAIAGGARPSAPLSRRAKAAIIVRLLLNEGADIPLEELPEDAQAHLTQQMGQMRTVDRETLVAVVDEFADEVERIGLSFPGGIAGALNVLDGKISPQTAARLRKEAGVRETGDPWIRIAEMGNDQLLPVLERESIEVAAVLLSKLDVAKAAGLLGELPGPRARQITYAVSLTGAVAPAAVDRIGLSIAAQLDARPVRAFDADPVERVGAILNSSTSITRDDMLAGLDETDEGFARAVRKSIFTFAHIAKRVASRDIPRILRDIDQADLLVALGGAEDAGMKPSADFILENMSGRLADQLREEMEETDKPKPAAVDEAMNKVVAVIRNMEKAGDLIFLTEDEDEDAGA